MTWQSTVDGHGLWIAIEQVRDLCRSEGWPDDDEVRDVVARAIWLCEQIQSRKDIYSITFDSLNNALAGMNGIRENLSALRTDPPTGNSDSVRASIDQVLTAISTWPASSAAASTQAVREASLQFQKLANEALESLRVDVAGIQAGISTQLAKWIGQASSEVESATAVNAKLQAEVAAATTELTAQKTRLDTALTEFAANSLATEKARDVAESDALKSRDQVAAEQLEIQKTSASEALQSMDALLAQARTTLQTIGKEASASHYGTYANEQRKAAFLWSMGVLLALAAAAIFLAWAAKENLSTWHAAAARYALGVVFVGAATYAGRQSAHHRAQERQARQRELAIGALGSFLADVPPGDVQKLKLGVAADLFIDEGLPDTNQATYQSPGSQIAEAIRTALGLGNHPPGI